MIQTNRCPSYAVGLALLSATLGTLATGCGIWPPAPTPDKPTVTILPELYEGGQTIPTKISRDGKVIVGYCISPGDIVGQPAAMQAFRWSSTEGLVAMGFLPGKSLSIATATNGDGSIVVGYGVNPDEDIEQAWIWTAATGMQALPPPRDGAQTEAYDVSDDGTLLGRYAYMQEDGLVWQAPFLWSSANGYGNFPLDNWGGTTDLVVENPASIAADGLSLILDRYCPDPSDPIPQGAWLVGFGLPFGGGEWSQYPMQIQSGLKFYPRPRAYTSNPLTIGGESVHMDQGAPWSVPAIWTPASGVQVLNDAAPATTWCVSPDGTWAGGGNGDAHTAFVWNNRLGHMNLLLYVQQLDWVLGTHAYDTFVDQGFPSNVLGIAAGNKRFVGTADSSIFGHPCRTFILDLP